MQACIAGVNMIPFTKPGQSDPFELMGEQAARSALVDAGIPYGAVQRAFAGYLFGNTCAGQEALYRVGMTGIPVVNVNNACASGSTALMLAREAVESGQVEVALALGFEQMEAGPIVLPFASRSTGAKLKAMAARLNESFDPTVATAPQVYADAGTELMRRYGFKHETFARITVKSRRHASSNPYAVFRKPMTVEEVLADKPISGPLTRSMCSPPTCGAAAVVVVSEKYVREKGISKAVRILGQALVTDDEDSFRDSMIDAVGASLSRRASTIAYEKAGIDPADVDVVELHDCFASNELISYEALGFCGDGQSEKMVFDGDNTYGGKRVINPSGGLISKGHPIGATGLAQITELTWHLRGTAGDRQVEGARLAVQHNVGLGGACIVTVLSL